jgi:hypothetical protein
MWRAMRGADLVRPQNVFVPMPWHAAWATARSLLNRTFGSDHPGTLGVRRSTFLDLGGYDGNVLFENLELVRTFLAGGAKVVDRPGLYVARRPPTARRFWSQRVRQAYDDLAQPARLARHLTVVPAVVALRRRPATLLLAAGAVVGVAELGRRRAEGIERFPTSASWLAVPWLLERGVAAWAAVALRWFRGGCPYAGTVIPRAASSVRRIRRRLRDRGHPSRVRPVAQGRQLGAAAPAEGDGRAPARELATMLVDDRDLAPNHERAGRVHVDRAAHVTPRSPG